MCTERWIASTAPVAAKADSFSPSGIALARPDAGEIVIDEIVAFWWVLLLLPRGGEPGLVQAAAFLLFRVFDILKPEPISWLEQRWPNAWGVMLDDLVAGTYTVLVIELWIRLA